jgi:hypothetical protein
MRRSRRGCNEEFGFGKLAEPALVMAQDVLTGVAIH